MSPTSAPPLKPEVTLPLDTGLPGLLRLFDGEWVWQAFCNEFGEPDERPTRIRPRQLRYRPGSQALVCFAVEWQRGRWVAEDQFAVELRARKPPRLFRYPEDPYLPGLRIAASAADAHGLLTKYVRSFSPQRLRVEAVRYRPATRAVLRHIASWRRARTGSVTLFARVMRPRQVEPLLAASGLAEHSGFNLPRLVGYWAEGGVVWMAKVPGDPVRTLVRRGTPPDPDRILGGLAKLWSSRVQPDQGHPFDLSGRFQTTERLLSQLLQSEEARRLLQQLTSILGPFSDEWRPSALAHNDFYDDQVVLTPEGQLVLVDFEEIGPGDPLLDVGKLLAHLRRAARFGSAQAACDTYRRQVRSAALARFGWEPQALDLREAIALFLLAPSPVRQLRRNWAKRVETGLILASEILDGSLSQAFN